MAFFYSREYTMQYPIKSTQTVGFAFEWSNIRNRTATNSSGTFFFRFLLLFSYWIKTKNLAKTNCVSNFKILKKMFLIQFFLFENLKSCFCFFFNSQLKQKMMKNQRYKMSIVCRDWSGPKANWVTPNKIE